VVILSKLRHLCQASFEKKTTNTLASEYSTDTLIFSFSPCHIHLVLWNMAKIPEQSLQSFFCFLMLGHLKIIPSFTSGHTAKFLPLKENAFLRLGRRHGFSTFSALFREPVFVRIRRVQKITETTSCGTCLWTHTGKTA